MKNQSANAKGWKSVAAGIDAAVNGGASSISLSFGACAASNGYKPAQQAFARALARNVSVFVSSGDAGALAGPVRDCGSKPSVGYPASDPSVIGVGGTSLLLDDNNLIVGELAWRLSGGGRGAPLLRPTWQVTPNLKPGKYRYSPDVAFLGNPSTGVSMVFKGRTQTAGGTSLGAPAWAAIWTLIREDGQRAGKKVPAGPATFYRIGNSSSYAQAFNDVTRGNNGYYQAAIGWDPVTGWGTPIVDGLASTILSLSPSAGSGA
jgi:subtilase family serine protease